VRRSPLEQSLPIEQQGAPHLLGLWEALQAAHIGVHGTAVDAEQIGGFFGWHKALDVHTQYDRLPLFPLSMNNGGQVDAVGSTKYCYDCDETKSVDQFPNSKSRKDGKYPYCRPCNTARMAKWVKENPEKSKLGTRRKTLKKYGLTLEVYEELLASQGGRCAICGTDKPGHTVGRMFDVDHDHETSKVRGLLCQHCNMGLGQFGDDLDRLREAVKYLEESGG
jgi:hypothetical protein